MLNEGADLRLRFLVEASGVLSMSLDYESVLDKMVHLAIKQFGGWCIVDLLDDQGKIHRVATGSHNTDEESRSRERFRNFSINLNAPAGPGRVIRTGEPEFIRKIMPQMLEPYARDTNHLTIMLSLGLESGMCFPITNRGNVLGAMSFISVNRPFSDTEFELAGELVRRCAMALENARLYYKAQQAIRDRDEFLSIASHELRTPLTPLKLQVQNIKRLSQNGKLSEFSPQKLQALLDTTDRQITRLSRLIDDLLDVSRITAGRLTLSPEQMNLTDMASEIIERYRPQFSIAGCRVVLNATDSVDGSWDRLRMEQVFINLLSNAMKYGAGKPIEISVRAEENIAHLSVADQGIGIAKSDQEKIFQRFERGGLSKNFGGLGLGLYIARQIVLAHGGQIRVESELGKGSKFIVELEKNER